VAVAEELLVEELLLPLLLWRLPRRRKRNLRQVSQSSCILVAILTAYPGGIR
jgi:hypothetical protein